MNLRNLPFTPAAAPVRPAVEADTGNSGDALGTDPRQWRSVLEDRWRRKLDQAIALCKARCDALAGDDEPVAATPSPHQLGLQIDHAYQELADIEDAIARVDAGTYGRCAACDRPMPAEWLTEDPQVRCCPECSLLLVTWQAWPGKRDARASRPAERVSVVTLSDAIPRQLQVTGS
jgi:DnaK suppressor protein